MASVTQLIEREEAGEIHKFESLLQLMLSYAKFGMIKYGDESLSEERIQTVFGLMDDIDRALLTHSAKERFQVVTLILIRCWDAVKDFLELCKQKQEEGAASGGTATAAETLSQMLQAIAGSSSIASGSSAPVPDSEKQEEQDASAGVRSMTHQDAEESNPPDGNGDAGLSKVNENAEEKPITQITMNVPSSRGLTALRSIMSEGRLSVVTAIMKLRIVPSRAPFARRASATGIVPKISAYMGTPTSVASTTPKGLRLPSTAATQLSGIQLWITAPMPTPIRMYGKTFLNVETT